MKYLLLFFMLLLSANANSQEIPKKRMACLEIGQAQDKLAEDGFVKFFMDDDSTVIWYSKSKRVVLNTVIREKDGVQLLCISDVYTKIREFGPV